MGSIASGLDLMGAVPTDLFASSAPEPVPSSGGETTLDATPELEGGETFETPDSIEEPPAEEVPVEAEPTEELPPTEETEVPPVEAKPAEDLPEGVSRGKNSKGKAGFFLEENRYQTIQGDHQLVRQVSEAIGEPATFDALKVRNDAFHAQERMFENLNSGEPGAQGEVLGYIFDEMARAKEAGEVGVDPSLSFAQTVYSSMREKAPAAYAELRMAGARDLINEMFSEAAANGDDSLFLSAQHFARALAGVGKDVTDIGQARAIAERAKIPFYSKAEMAGMAQGADPLSKMREERDALQAQLQGRSTTNQAEQFRVWNGQIGQAVKSAVLDGAVKPSLASVETGWKAFPQDYQRLVVDPLNREVTAAIQADSGFAARIKGLQDQAKRAVSEQRRSQIGDSIKQAYTNRAKLAVEAVKRPILEFAAKSLKGLSDQTHARRQDAQGRTAPRGTAAPVVTSILPSKSPGGAFDSMDAVKDASRYLYR